MNKKTIAIVTALAATMALGTTAAYANSHKKAKAAAGDKHTCKGEKHECKGEKKADEHKEGDSH